VSSNSLADQLADHPVELQTIPVPADPEHISAVLARVIARLERYPRALADLLPKEHDLR
jgi:hypothetical protein